MELQTIDGQIDARLIVLGHFIFCVAILGNVDSEKSITVSGVELSTMPEAETDGRWGELVSYGRAGLPRVV